MTDDSEITIRLPTGLLDAVDSWAADHDAARSEAILALLEHGLAAARIRMSEKQEFFPIPNAMSRADLETLGFDVTEVDDDTMRQLADQMAKTIEFMDDLQIAAERLEIPRK
jgi:hypothetical protein